MNKRIFLITTLLAFISLSSFAESGPSEIVYLNHYGLLKDLKLNPYYNLGRVRYEESELTQEQKDILRDLSSVTGTFPFAIYTNGRLHFKSDNNCTLVGETIFNNEIWQACRNHDYCFYDIHEYENKEGFLGALKRCNQRFRKDLNEICSKAPVGHEICHIVAEVYYQAVNRYPQAFSFIASQNKQALFLSEVLRSIKKRPFLKDRIDQSRVFDISLIRKKLKSFCTQLDRHLLNFNSAYATTYGNDRKVLINNQRFSECYQDKDGSYLVKELQK